MSDREVKRYCLILSCSLVFINMLSSISRASLSSNICTSARDVAWFKITGLPKNALLWKYCQNFWRVNDVTVLTSQSSSGLYFSVTKLSRFSDIHFGHKLSSKFLLLASLRFFANKEYSIFHYLRRNVNK